MLLNYSTQLLAYYCYVFLEKPNVCVKCEVLLLVSQLLNIINYIGGLSLMIKTYSAG